MFGNAFFFSSSRLILDGLNSSAAFSLRKLRTAYLGSAINVRRSSDGATQDIGFATAAQTRTNLAAIPINNNTGQTSAGVTMTTVGTGTEFGQPYIDVRWQGTASSTAFMTLGHGSRGVFNSALQAPVTPGLNYTASVGYRLLAGTLPPNQSQVDALFFSATGAFIVAASSIVPAATTALQRSAAIGLAPVGSAYCQPIWRVLVFSGTVVDFTMRFYAANVEQGIGNVRPLLQRNVPETIATIGELDADALLSFVGTGNGFVTTWYDQSGNSRNATQTTLVNQPQIVDSGAVQTENGRPVINFSGAAASSLIASGFTLPSSTNRFISTVQKIQTYKNTGVVWSNADTNNFGLQSDATAAYFFNGTPIALTPNFNATNVFLYTLNGTTGLINGGTNTHSVSTNSLMNGLIIGNSPGLSQNLSGSVAELIIINKTLSTTDRQTIERNQGQFYGITII
jgi:hypothetical protein